MAPAKNSRSGTGTNNPGMDRLFNITRPASQMDFALRFVVHLFRLPFKKIVIDMKLKCCIIL